MADNKTLAAIAVRRPSDEAGLLAVPGIGQRKVAGYGDEILAMTSAFEQQPAQTTEVASVLDALEDLTGDHIVDILKVAGPLDAGLLALMLTGSPSQRSRDLLAIRALPWVAVLLGFDYRSVREHVLALAHDDARLNVGHEDVISLGS